MKEIITIKLPILLIIFQLLYCYNKQVDGFAVLVDDNDKDKICFFNILNRNIEQCVKLDNFISWDQIPNRGLYKDLLRKKNINKELIKISSMYKNLDELRKKLAYKTCDKDFLFSDPHLEFPKFYLNSYYDFIYDVLSKKEFELNPHPVNVKNKLCGIKNGKCEIIYNYSFCDFFAVAEGKYVLLEKECKADIHTLYSLEPQTKKQILLLNSKDSISFFQLNLHQSIISANKKETYVFDHNKNLLKHFFNIPDKLSGYFINEILSIKDRYLIFRVSGSLIEENFIIIFDFKNNIKEPNVEIVPTQWIRELKTYEEPFEFQM